MGLIAMTFTSLAFFSGYDFVINRITKSEPKGLWQSISSYWTLLTLVPLGLGLSFYISGLIQQALDDYKIGFNFFEILPFVIIWGLFFISYSSSIQKGTLKSLIFVSFAAGAIWYIGKNLFVYYIVYNKTYASVYGSFSTILFFFIWIYISWIVYLFGIKIYYFLNHNHDKGDKIRKNTKKIVYHTEKRGKNCQPTTNYSSSVTKQRAFSIAIASFPTPNLLKGCARQLVA